MKFIRYIYVLAVVLAFSVSAVSAAQPQDSFKLKPGAKGKICLTCHTNFSDKMKNPFLHTPVKTGDCTGCHNAHTSRHGKLLAAGPNKICTTCHRAMVPEKAASFHSSVAKGECVKCHDPHGSNSKFVLLKGGSELCFDCHKDMGEAIKKARFKHNPVEKGCTSCHEAHASTTGKSLLKGSDPALCLQCHKTDKPSFVTRHSGYPVGKARCSTCHDPHGSDRGAILLENIHMPVANKQCGECHFGAASQTPFATKKPGYELCSGCHSRTMNDIFGKNKMHWPVMGNKGCQSCHNPHGAKMKKLVKEPMLTLCGRCHSDTIARQERSMLKHAPIKEGNCTACHAPHSSNNDFLLNESSVVELCGTCHDWYKHSTHPIGEKVLDTRNKNLHVQCLSCHRSHGSEYKFMMYYPQTTEMCTQCHAQLKR